GRVRLDDLRRGAWAESDSVRYLGSSRDAFLAGQGDWGVVASDGKQGFLATPELRVSLAAGIAHAPARGILQDAHHHATPLAPRSLAWADQ
ncbi:hypothetical protein, partial [Enterococcus faecium]|uniref:hypothetical protein n=1 Tax=Enterococcus faecium TaxID=1352 RepID=UPI0039BE4E13